MCRQNLRDKTIVARPPGSPRTGEMCRLALFEKLTERRQGLRIGIVQTVLENLVSFFAERLDVVRHGVLLT